MLTKLDSFNRRKLRVRNKVKVSNKSNHPRVIVFRSNKNFYAQLVDSCNGNIVASCSSLKVKDLIKKDHKGVDVASIVGENFAKLCVENNITKVVFDKAAYLYSGRVKCFADSCRSNGLKF